MSPLAPAAAGRRILHAAGDWRPARRRQHLLFLLAGLPLAIVAPAAVTVCWLAAVPLLPAPRATAGCWPCCPS